MICHVALVQKLLPMLRKHCCRSELLHLAQKYEDAATSGQFNLARDWLDGRLKEQPVISQAQQSSAAGPSSATLPAQ